MVGTTAAQCKWGYNSFGLLWKVKIILFKILVLSALILLIIWLYKQIKGPQAQESALIESPLDILKKRYAKGEIDKKEFEEKKKDLE